MQNSKLWKKKFGLLLSVEEDYRCPEHAARTKRKIINLRFVESNEHAITLTIVSL